MNNEDRYEIHVINRNNWIIRRTLILGDEILMRRYLGRPPRVVVVARVEPSGLTADLVWRGGVTFFLRGGRNTTFYWDFEDYLSGFSESVTIEQLPWWCLWGEYYVWYLTHIFHGIMGDQAWRTFCFYVRLDVALWN